MHVVVTGPHTTRETQKRTNADDPEKVEEEAITRKVNSLLNKLRNDRFDSVSDQIMNVGITRESILKSVIEQIFQKASDEPNLSAIYASLCLKLSKDLPKIQTWIDISAKNSAFRRALLTRCQEEFEQGVRWPESEKKSERSREARSKVDTITDEVEEDISAKMDTKTAPAKVDPNPGKADAPAPRQEIEETSKAPMFPIRADAHLSETKASPPATKVKTPVKDKTEPTPVAEQADAEESIKTLKDGPRKLGSRPSMALLESFECICYPESVPSPSREPGMPFRYQRDFLMQFAEIAKERPEGLPTHSDIYGDVKSTAPRRDSKGQAGSMSRQDSSIDARGTKSKDPRAAAMA
ncbi:armadillo-type protein [Phlyctochytrium arcticum]|nr:armadillo-type protein [Phlyctochytrium arcticum]